MHFENASTGPGATRRSKPSKKSRKRGSLITAIRNHQAMIAQKGFSSPLDNSALDSATNAALAEVKMRIARI